MSNLAYNKLGDKVFIRKFILMSLELNNDDKKKKKNIRNLHYILKYKV